MERVIVRQYKDYGTEFLATDPEDEQSEFAPVTGLHEVTPYGMLLASLGSCTAILLHSYSQSHGIPLDEVHLSLSYGRQFDEDCEHCEEEDDYDDQVLMAIDLIGDLQASQRTRLMKIAERCPIDQILQKGIPVVIKTATDQESIP